MNLRADSKVLLTPILIFLTSCADKTGLLDLNTSLTVDQDASKYIYNYTGTDTQITTDKSTEVLKSNYLKKHYSVWKNTPVLNRAQVFWVLPVLKRVISLDNKSKRLRSNPPLKNTPNYAEELSKYKERLSKIENSMTTLLGAGENLLPYSPEEIQGIIEEINEDKFIKRSQLAIVTHASSIRVVPTMKPFYKSRTDFPFDRWQNSLIFEGTPVQILHYSKSGRFAYVATSFVHGWIETRNIANVDEGLKDSIIAIKDYKVTNQDLLPIKYRNRWVMDARVGQVIPYNAEKDKIAIFVRDINGNAKILEANYPKEHLVDFPIPFTEERMAGLVNSLLGQKYGWGGILGNRDCSAFTRDSFANFGVFLPRNSTAQIKSNSSLVDLSGLDNLQKEEYILNNAKPFATILWLKGHIMLYIGSLESNGKKYATVAHSIWGVTSFTENDRSTKLIGKVNVTTLWIGANSTEDANPNLLISRVTAMSHIF